MVVCVGSLDMLLLQLTFIQLRKHQNMRRKFYLRIKNFEGELLN
uniref:Uncharacterized protein n=1 Tax=Cucumis melo TaxID=3656 RepID=A0A9I9EL81_CUCME